MKTQVAHPPRLADRIFDIRALWIVFQLFTVAMILLSLQATARAQTDTVAITVDAGETVGTMDPIWAYFGYDEPNYTYMHDGRKLLSEISDLSPVPVYVRTHNLLTTGNGEAALKWGSTNAYTEDKNGKPVYDWTITDKIFDTYIERGMKPLVEVGFMPKALSSHPEPYRHQWSPDQPYENIFTGWAYPPKDYEKWAELVYRWVEHNVDRYGKEEVESWIWEPWNEPNIDYWQGNKQEYFKLYDYTADAIKRALPTATVGGPHTTGPRWDQAAGWLRDFLEHCKNGKNYATGETGAPLDYIAYHAKGAPRVVDGHVRMNMGAQLDDIATGFKIVSESAFSDLPIIIGEADPEGCAACSMELHPENAYRNGTMYSSYTASSFAKMYRLADQYGVNFEGALSWSFEFENEDWFAGFRSLATNGVDKPVLNVFRMFGMMDGKRLAVQRSNAITAEEIIEQGVRGSKADVNALASQTDDALYIMVWNYHDDDLPAPETPVKLQLDGLRSGKALLHHYRVDEEHSNSYTLWRQMGAPQQTTHEQYQKLEEAGQLDLLTSPRWISTQKEGTVIDFDLPRRGVSLLKLEWK